MMLGLVSEVLRFAREMLGWVGEMLGLDLEMLGWVGEMLGLDLEMLGFVSEMLRFAREMLGWVGEMLGLDLEMLGWIPHKTKTSYLYFNYCTDNNKHFKIFFIAIVNCYYQTPLTHDEVCLKQHDI